MKTYIYTLSDSSGIKYIGKSDMPDKRFKIHLKESKLRRTRKERWIYNLLQNGEIPEMEILDMVDISNWSFFESYWISQLKTWGFKLLNGTDGGEGSNGFKGKSHSTETREKLKKLAEGRKGISLPGERNGRSKMMESEVIEIKKHLSDGNLKYREICIMFPNATKTTISLISSGKRWGHIKI